MIRKNHRRTLIIELQELRQKHDSLKASYDKDITERQLMEDKVRSSEERWKVLFDYAPDAYYLSDLKGNFIDGNFAAQKFLWVLIKMS